MNSVPTTKIWIVRRGNGKAEVHPSPVVLTYGEEFSIRNLTEQTVEVEFPPDFIIPLPCEILSARQKECIAAGQLAGIPAGGIAVYRVAVAGPRFFEYKVNLPEIHQYAEGGSKPGVIIDP